MNGIEERIEHEIENGMKSRGERSIARTLHQYDIPYRYEPLLQLHDNGIQRTIRPDFYLPIDNLYIEYFGRITNPEYDQRMRHKQRLYAQNNLHLISVYPWTLAHDWPYNLLEQIHEHRPQYLRQDGHSAVPAYSSHPKPYRGNNVHQRSRYGRTTDHQPGRSYR
jgi:hypothetical protein